MNRREFIRTTASAAAFSIVPGHVLGGMNYVAPSDKLNLAYIGCGTQGLREMSELITNEDIQIVSVCDPNKFTTNYVDWSRYGLRNTIRKAMGDSTWGENLDGIPGGRDVGKELVDKHYAGQSSSGKFKGCTSYADFRELLEKEKDIDAVKVMTPDHLHAAISIAAMKKKKHVVMHKPIANRMHEAKVTLDTVKKTGVNSHFLAWSKRSGVETAFQWVKKGAIGKLREIHNWSNRPVWPQWTSKPTEAQKVPDGFDWDLWLGPVPHRPYHPNYTHAVFRGWYDFGAGSIADMGHYSLWPLFMTFGIDTPPESAEAYGTTTSIIENHVSKREQNDVAFPYSCIIRFNFPEQKELPPFKLFWYDGGMKPHTPDELDQEDKELPSEGMMFVGDKGKILGSFRCDSPRIIPEKKMVEFTGSSEPPEDKVVRNDRVWIDAFKKGEQSPGHFLKTGPVTETILLGGVALRAGKKIKYDTQQMRITNNKEANKYLYREYRKGWEI
ncbi:MAG: Gfo/Idh/MocA family oxidoreductase [Bacteroidales bacterium]|nr:Gfo/Idh/MocA family oxidoreductase [Bacteroidales bacterium]